MPRNSLRNLGTAQPTAAQPTTAPAQPAALPADLPPELQELMQEREALEARMAALTGGTANAGSARPGAMPSGGDQGRRFPVTALGDRRAQDAQWARRRENRRDTARGELAELVRDPVPALRERLLPDGAEEAFRDPPERTGQRALRDVADRMRAPIADPIDAAMDVLPLREGPALRDPFSSRDDPPRLRREETTRRDRPTQQESLPLREITPRLPEPPFAEPRVPALTNLDDRLSGARRKLDILKGGSGDLDELRKKAQQRARERRAETDRDRRRDQARTSNARDTRDEKRDNDRLENRPRRRARSTESE